MGAGDVELPAPREEHIRPAPVPYGEDDEQGQASVGWAWGSSWGGRWAKRSAFPSELIFDFSFIIIIFFL